MVDRDAIPSRQQVWLTDVGRVPPRRRRSPRHGKWGTAIIGLLLASGAGVYTYRQFIQPASDAEDTAPDAPLAGLPAPGFDQLAVLRETTKPLETPVAAAPTSKPAPQEQRVAARQTSLRPSSDGAFHGERSTAVAAVSGMPPSPGPQQPAAEIGEMVPSSTLPNDDPPLLAVTVADSGELTHGLSTELSS
jgi:hypothetical protein